MSDLISTRGHEHIDLNNPSVRSLYEKRTPSIFNTEHKTQSSRYQVFNTMDVVNELARHNYLPTRIIQKYSRKDRANDIYQQHSIRFAHKDVDLLSSNYNEVVLYNSYDSESAMLLYPSGWYRQLCSNQLLSAESLVKIEHFKHNQAIFEDIIKKTISGIEKTNEQIEKFKNTKLSDSAIFEFCKNAVNNRWEYRANENDFDRDEITNEYVEKAYSNDETIESANKIHRPEDASNMAWQVLNRVQENVLSNKLSIVSIGKSKIPNTRQCKKVTSINDDRKINIALWENMTELAFN